MFEKTTYFVDTTTGPKIYTRRRLKLLPLLAIIFAILLVASMALLATPSTPVQAETFAEPQITLCRTNVNTLIFQDLSGNCLAYVDAATSEQFEQIMALNIIADESVNDFTCCNTNPRYYEIRIGGNIVCCYADDATIPPQYNLDVDDQELLDSLSNSSSETNYLYTELNKIFKIS